MYLAALPFVIKHVDAKAGVIVVVEARLPEVRFLKIELLTIFPESSSPF